MQKFSNYIVAALIPKVPLVAMTDLDHQAHFAN
jgi:hypothetical protein